MMAATMSPFVKIVHPLGAHLFGCDEPGWNIEQRRTVEGLKGSSETGVSVAIASLQKATFTVG
jgi:hypothetical protein